MSHMQFRVTGRLANQVMVFVYSKEQLVGGTSPFKARLAERFVSGTPREALEILEQELDRIDDLELLDGDFLPDDGANSVPMDFHGGVTHLITRLAIAKRADTTYSQVLGWQEQGLLHPVRLDFSRRPEIFYTQREVDETLRKLNITPQKEEPITSPPHPLPDIQVPNPRTEIERLQSELSHARLTAEHEKVRREMLAEQLKHERQEKALLIKNLSERRSWLRRRKSSS
jgi:hypothetical protein